MRALATVSGSTNDLVAAGRRSPLEGDRTGAAPVALGRRGGRLGRLAEPLLRQVGGVGKAGGVVAHDPDAGAPLPAGHEFLDLAVVETSRRHAPILGKDLGEVAAMAQRRLERALEYRFFDQVASRGGCLS